jgi:Tfp pilus assembly protein PilZ
MDMWHLKDSHGNVVGPLSREVAIDLLRSRPGVFLHSSRDGGPWQPVRAPATQTLVAAEDRGVRASREQQEAERALLELDRFRELEPNHLFGVPKGAALKDYRKGFLALAKRYHPARLPKDVSAALLRANMAVYQYLTEVMHGLEMRLGSGAPAPAPHPSAPPRPGAIPTWQLDALQLRLNREQLQGRFKVTRATAFVFSVHRLMNLTNGAVFFPCLPSLALGTRLGLAFEFEEAARTVASRGAVAWDSSSSGSTPHGFGVRLDIRPEDKGFMVSEAQRLLSAR